MKHKLLISTIIVVMLLVVLYFYNQHGWPSPSALFFRTTYLPNGRSKVIIGEHFVNIDDPNAGPVGMDHHFHAWYLLAIEDAIRANVATNLVRDNRFWFLTHEDPQFAQVIALCEEFPDYEKIRPTVNKLLSSKECLNSYDDLDLCYNQRIEYIYACVWICDPSQKILIYLDVKR